MDGMDSAPNVDFSLVGSLLSRLDSRDITRGLRRVHMQGFLGLKALGEMLRNTEEHKAILECKIDDELHMIVRRCCNMLLIIPP